MKETLIINTGGTFNKSYNPISGENELDESILPSILKKWNAKYEYINIIWKDSLFFNETDRILLLDTINKHEDKKIVVIHGTDTMTISANFVHENTIGRKIVFTGAMTPYWMKETEASLNLGFALGLISNCPDGVYITMNGISEICWKIKKDKVKGEFVRIKGL